MTNIERRGLEAAKSYLDRTGMAVVEEHWPEDGPHKVDLVALDGETLVLCDVTTKRSAPSAPDAPTGSRRRSALRRIGLRYMAGADGAIKRVRYDRISILVVGPDRALLRHHREQTNLEDGGKQAGA